MEAMDSLDALSLAEAQVRMAMDDSGIMTITKMVEAARDWSSRPEDADFIVAGLWAGFIDASH